jgi:hypothetical protein
MFAVAKSATEDRMITDRRPANELEAPVGAVKDLFPHASQLAEIYLEDDQVLVAHGDDLPHYYFTIGVGEARSLYNQLGPPLTFKEVEGTRAHAEFLQQYMAERQRDYNMSASSAAKYEVPDGQVLRALQTTLPMGDRSATDFGHVGHVNVLRKFGGALPSELVSYRSPFPLGPTHEWVCVDDHIITQVLPRSATVLPTEDDDERRDLDLLARADKAYAHARLKTVDKKRFRGKSRFTALGGHVDGDVGWVGAKPGLILLFLGLAQSILQRRRVWGRVLSTAVGLLSHILMFRREGFSILNLVYREVRRLGPSGCKVGALHPGAIDELAVAACLMPLFGSSLRVDVSEAVLCSDACGGGRARGGGVRTTVPRSLARRLWRHRLRKGGFVYIESKVGALFRHYQQGHGEWDDSYDPEPELGPRFFGDLADGLSWRKLFDFPLDGDEHVNLLEHRALTTIVLSEIRRSGGNQKLLCGVDSDVAACVAAKGRSHSWRLNGSQRRLGMQLLFAGVQLGLLRTPSSQNPADNPSRRRPVRVGPAIDVAEWARSVLRGDFDLLDDKLFHDSRERWFVWDADGNRYCSPGRRRGEEDSPCGDGP